MAGLDEIKKPIITTREVQRFILDALKVLGTNDEHAKELADLIIEADIRGHYSHGLNSFHRFLFDIQHKLCDSNSVPFIIKESDSTAWVDGNNALGPIVGNFCIKLAIEKARNFGVGLVSCKNSNNFGIGGKYCEQASENNMIGLVVGTSSPLMIPTRAKHPGLGTNCFSFCAPARRPDDNMHFDIATTTVAGGKIDNYRRQRLPVPYGWAYNAQGIIETDSEVAAKCKRLTPVGGLEETGGYKGTGLALIVDILTSVLSDATLGPELRHWGVNPKAGPANVSQAFFVINPEFFALGFNDRMSSVATYVRRMEPLEPYMQVLIPGDREREHRKMVHDLGGIIYPPDLINNYQRLAASLKIKPLQPILED